jgi:hypothetical protein
MSLVMFTSPLLPPGNPLLPRLNTNTHAGILPVSASSNLMRSQNANVDNLVDGCFVSLPEMDAFGNGKILGEGGIADQTKNAPLFPMGLSMTSSLVEVDGTLEGTVLKGVERGSIFPTSSLSTRRAHNSHINSNIFFLVLMM